MKGGSAATVMAPRLRVRTVEKAGRSGNGDRYRARTLHGKWSAHHTDPTQERGLIQGRRYHLRTHGDAL